MCRLFGTIGRLQENAVRSADCQLERDVNVGDGDAGKIARTGGGN